jgi:hypothetical protein
VYGARPRPTAVAAVLFSSTIRKTEPGRDGAVAEGDLRPAEGAEADEFAWWCARQLCCNRFWAGIAALAVALSPLKLVVATGLMSDVAYLAFLAATIRLESISAITPLPHISCSHQMGNRNQDLELAGVPGTPQQT